MTGGIIRYNFESRHYKDDSDKLWFKFSLWSSIKCDAKNNCWFLCV